MNNALDTMKKQLKDLMETAQKLEKQISEIEEKQNDFASMSYDELMKYYVKHLSHICDWDKSEKPEDLVKVAEWQKAYQPFKIARAKRNEVIRKMYQEYVNLNEPPYLQNDIVKALYDSIRKTYETMTPFDCTDPKWTHKYYGEETWFRRIKNQIGGHMRELNPRYRSQNEIVYHEYF